MCLSILCGIVPLIAATVRNQQCTRVAFEPAQQETIGLWPWWTIKQPRVLQVHTGLHESWRECLRLNRSIEHDESKILLLLCTINKDDGKVFHAVEIAGCNVWMIVWHRFPYRDPLVREPR